MQIVSVDIYLLDGGRPGWRPIVCRVNTDEGICGYGEASVGFDCGAEGAFGMLREMASMVIGMDPLATQVVWNHMFRDSFWAQGGGVIAFSAISAIDTALWDIRGKVYQVPVYQLLGGKMHSSLRSYASQLQFGWSDRGMVFDKGYRAEDLAASARAAVQEGYDAVKINFITYDAHGGRLGYLTGPLTPDVRHLVDERVAAVRKAVGDEVDILAENHGRSDLTSAVELSEIFKAYGVAFMEEPNTPMQLDTCNELALRSQIPIAGGERIFGRRNFLNFFEHHALKVAQPDIGTAGGISEVRKIADMAQAFDISVQTHVCGSPIVIAASLQLECTLANFYIHEHHVTNLSEANRRLGKYDYQPVNGQYQIPDLPGIGQELSEQAIREARMHVLVQ